MTLPMVSPLARGVVVKPVKAGVWPKVFELLFAVTVNGAGVTVSAPLT